MDTDYPRPERAEIVLFQQATAYVLLLSRPVAHAVVAPSKYRTDHAEEYMSLIDQFGEQITGMGIRTSATHGRQYRMH